MADEYEHVARSKLKLKTDSSKISKKKKKDKKNREKLEREHEQQREALNDSQSSAAPRRTMTKAELSFKKMQEKMVSRIFPNFQLKWMAFVLCGVLSLLSARETNHGKGITNAQAARREIQRTFRQSNGAL